MLYKEFVCRAKDDKMG